MKVFGILLLAVPLFGCYTVQQDSTKEDAILLTMHNSSNSSAVIMTFDDSEVCSGKNLVLPEVAVGESRAIKIPFNHEVTFGVRQIVSGDPVRGVSCQVIGTFEPTAGRRYVADYFVKMNSCVINLVELGKDESDLGAAVVKPTTSREWSRPVFERGPSCKKR